MSSPSQPISPANRLQRKLATLAEVTTRHTEKAAWRVNDALARLAGRWRGLASPESPIFVNRPMALGQVSPKTLAALRETIFAAPQAEFAASDHAPGYVFNPDGEALARIFDGGFRFRRIDTPQLRAIAALMTEVAPNITRHLGSGWRIINLKSWSVRVDTVQQGPNSWHLDGFPVGTFKLMIYLTPIGAADGTTEVRFADGSSQILEGDAGTYLLFDPSVLWHRGVAPTASNVERTHIEISLMRSPTIDLDIVQGGLNSAYPRLPWTRRPIRPM